MRVAIYARYSSENQRQESIEDQVRVCKEFAKREGFTVIESHIYWDEARSGSIRNRPGLDNLVKACEAKQFEAVLVDDLSRLSRNNHHLLTLCAQLQYWQVDLFFVADGLNTKEEHSKLGIQMRGIINELYLDDLKEKTHRGQVGQKLRGFVVGEGTYGYRHQAVGETKVDNKGRIRADGYKAVIEPEEAAIILRIFESFGKGKAVTEIVSRLNEEKIPTHRRMNGGWNASTVSRILKNKKYPGYWVWNKTRNVRDPMSGKKRPVPRPESEWIIRQEEHLRLISDELWKKVEARWKEINGTWPCRKGKRGFEGQQKSYVVTHPPHLLAGTLRCGECGAAVIQVSGKGSGYYGCSNAKKKTCSNCLLVPRKRIEDALLNKIQQDLLEPEKIHEILKRVEMEIEKQFATVPEELKLKKGHLEKVQDKINHFVRFVSEGRASKAIADALTDAERDEQTLKQDVEVLEQSRQGLFQTPPVEWISHRLKDLQSILEKNTSESALVLRRLMGPITLTPVKPDIGKPYYQLNTKFNSVAILPKEGKGSNSLDVLPGT